MKRPLFEAVAATELAKVESSPYWPPNIVKLAKEYSHGGVGLPPGTKTIIDNDGGNPHQLVLVDQSGHGNHRYLGQGLW